MREEGSLLRAYRGLFKKHSEYNEEACIFCRYNILQRLAEGRLERRTGDLSASRMLSSIVILEPGDSGMLELTLGRHNQCADQSLREKSRRHSEQTDKICKQYKTVNVIVFKPLSPWRFNFELMYLTLWEQS